MNIVKLSFVAAGCLGCVLFTACGDITPATLKLAAAIVKTQDDVLEKNRTPEAVAQRFLKAFTEADFTLAVRFCAGNAKVFMETCIANQNLHDPKDFAFREKQFSAYTTVRMNDCALQSKNIVDDNNVELIFESKKSAKFTYGKDRPKGFTIAQDLLMHNVTDSEIRREEYCKKIAIEETPAKKIVFLMKFDKALKRWMITDILDYDLYYEAQQEKGHNYNSEFEKIAAEAEEQEKEMKKKAAAPAADAQESGMPGDDYGFEM